MRGICLSRFLIAPRLVQDREPPMRRHVEELPAGKDGPRGKEFNMPGRLRLTYEANPMALHPRIPVLLRSRREVDVVARCHA